MCATPTGRVMPVTRRFQSIVDMAPRSNVIELTVWFSLGNFQVEISTIASNFHIEVNPSDAGIHDYTIVREMLKEVRVHFVLYIAACRWCTH
jgi:hypothetical protein